MKSFLIFIFILIVSPLYLYSSSFLVHEPILDSKVHIKFYGNKKNPPIVFVHGLGNEASTIWAQSISRLKDRFYIMTFDLPGFGKSSKKSSEYTPLNYSLILDYLTSKYFHSPFVLVGHSLGGAISLKFVSMYPNKVSKLVLIDVAGVLHKEAYSKFLIAMRLNSNTETNDSKLATFFNTIITKTEKILPIDLNTIVDSPLRNMVSPPTLAAISLATEDFSNIPEKITQKTLIIWGGNDNVAPIRTGYVLNKLIPNSQLKIIKEALHLPMTHNFDEYYKHFNNFLMNTNETTNPKNITVNNKDVVTLSSKRDMVLTGTFKKLIINKSRNILLKDCKIEELTVYDSDVHLLSSEVASKNFAIKVEYSNLLITSSVVRAKKPIISQSSRLDIAGSVLVGEKNAIFNMNKRNNTHVIFSLTKLSTKYKKNKVMHKKMVLVSDNKI